MQISEEIDYSVGESPRTPDVKPGKYVPLTASRNGVVMRVRSSLTRSKPTKFFGLDKKNELRIILSELQHISTNNGKEGVFLSVGVARQVVRIIEGTWRAADRNEMGSLTVENLVQFLENISRKTEIGVVDEVVDVEPITPKVLKLSAEEVQSLRDEVREMAHKGRPKEGIPLYKGLRGGDGDAVSFFKKHYKRIYYRRVIV